MRTPGWLPRRLAVALVAVAIIAPLQGAGPPVALAADYPAHCQRPADPVVMADQLMANRYTLTPHPTVRLPSNPTWAENPLHSGNWQFQYHSLRFTLSLFEAWSITGSTAYRDRALFLLRDWYRHNPRSGAPSAYSWDRHATAWRAMVYACAADLTPMTTWLKAALTLHGRTLASSSFYVYHGNHALNQAIGLLEVGRVLGRSDWKLLARDRINRLILESVDSQGVTNEQAVGYQNYNYHQYRLAEDRLRAARLTPGTGFARVDLMPRFLKEATLPNGQWEMLGDTEAGKVRELAAPDPPLPKVVAYRAGYLFARSGWGESRAYGDETFFSVRWGPGRRYHGHSDGTSLTLYAWGTRLLVDPGKYVYGASRWRTFMLSHQAHNVVTVDGHAWAASASTSLVSRTTTAALVDVRLRTLGYSGVTERRRITWSRNLDYLIVEDRLTASHRHTYRQLWHLVQDANLAVSGSTVRTRREGGNVLIRQLVGSPTIRVVRGSTDPIQGWISYAYGVKVAAPVVQAIRTGANVRYLTLIVPSQGQADVAVSDLRVTTDGYRVTVTIGGQSERVIASGSTVSITSVAGG